MVFPRSQQTVTFLQRWTPERRTVPRTSKYQNAATEPHKLVALPINLPPNHPTTVFMTTPLDFGNTNFSHEDDQDHSADQSAMSFLGFDMRDLDEDVAILRGEYSHSEALTPSGAAFEKVLPPVAAAAASAATAPPPSLSRTTSTRKSKPQGIRKRRRRKRVRRLCNIQGCPNRVVQGGVCVTHGAKRKQCKFPGCDKTVKKEGLCSSHGPARKKCEVPGCSRVAVQAGICIGHGAKKNQCSMEGCRRIALETGLCKLHQGETSQPPSTPALATSSSKTPLSPAEAFISPGQCQEIPSLAVAAAIAQAPPPSWAFQQTMYARGLSIFEEMGVESGRIVGNPLPPPPPLHTTPQFQRPRHRSTFSRDLQSLYDEDLDLDKFESIYR